MEELNEKVRQVLVAVAAQAASSGDAASELRRRQALARLKDGSELAVDITPDLALGIGDDREKLSEQLKKKGLDIETADMLGVVPYRDTWSWIESLSQSFTKAWSQRVDLLDLLEKACQSCEALINCWQYEVAVVMYEQLMDKLLQLRGQVQVQPTADAPLRSRQVSICMRYTLGRCMTVYSRSIRRDERMRRRDTVDALRDVLRDTLEAVQLLDSQPGGVREELYWVTYNASILAMRVARFLRLKGFAGVVAVPALWWLAEAMATYLPLRVLHMLPLRLRFLLELVACAESGQLLHEAARACDFALKQIEEARELEAMVDPMPEETSKLLATMSIRFQMLKIKYDFWLGVEGVKADPKAKDKDPAPAGIGKVLQEASALEGPSSKVVACLLEVLQVQHGLALHLGRPKKAPPPDAAPPVSEKDAKAAAKAKGKAAAKEAARSGSKVKSKEAAAAAAAADASSRPGTQGGSPQVTVFMEDDVMEKQATLVEAIINAVRPLIEKATKATKALDDYSKKRIAFEMFDQRRAAGQLEQTIVPDEAASEGASSKEVVDPPAALSPQELEELGFAQADSSGSHVLEHQFPLAAHILVMKVCFKHQLEAPDTKLREHFDFLEQSLLHRVRYKHFLCPPLIDIDVIVTSEKDKAKKAELPEDFEYLSDDINAWSQRNRQLEKEQNASAAEALAAKSPPRPSSAAPLKGRHVFLIGRRYNAWEKWVPEYPPPVPRIGNLRVVFGMRPVGGGGDAPDLDGARGPVGTFNPLAEGGVGEVPEPWLKSYPISTASDGAGFDSMAEASEDREALLQKMIEAGHIKDKYLQLPIEPHPGSQQGSGRETLPFIAYSIFNEHTVWANDEEVQKRSSEGHFTLRPGSALPPITEEDPKEAAKGSEGGADGLVPPWCFLLDEVNLATLPVSDIRAFLTKQLHASMPAEHFNVLLRADLRQTPAELLGRPFQVHIFLCAAAEAPSSVYVMRQWRLLRAARALHLAATKPAGDRPTSAAQAEGAEAPQETRNPVLDRLLDFGEVLSRIFRGPAGHMFHMEAADLVDEVCTHAFSQHVWPQVRLIEKKLKEHEVKERLISEEERIDLSEWTRVLLQVLPPLLRTLDGTRSVDALTLGSAAYGLSRLQMVENGSSSAQMELGLAIARLESELTEMAVLGSQPQQDRTVGSAISFDPPSLRRPDFAFYQDGDGSLADGIKADNSAPPLVLHKASRIEQDYLCLLAKLYEKWIDASLKVHLKNVNSTVQKARRTGEVVAEDSSHLAHLDSQSSQKLSLSNQEVSFLGRLGENPYLRCLFFIAVAERRPEAAALALGRALQEVELAETQERDLWNFMAQELHRQQVLARENGDFAMEFKAGSLASKKPRAHPPVLFGRSPTKIRLRAPPLRGGAPPLLPTSQELKTTPQEYVQEHHTHQLGKKSPAASLTSCAVFGKAAGSGTSVSEIHRSLPGTGVRVKGYDYVEVSGLKPNTNYTFASCFYEGLEMARPAVSSVSETTPPIGAYFPLPLPWLRCQVCKAILKAGKSASHHWPRGFDPLFDSLCERTIPHEEKGSFGLRTHKLRLDVVDRLAPPVLTAFADLLLVRNQATADGKVSFPATRPQQLSMLKTANECLLAADCARRAQSAELATRGVSMTLQLVNRLLQFRTKPRMLFGALVKCSMVLEALDKQLARPATATTSGEGQPPAAPPPTSQGERESRWHSQAREMCAYLYHQLTVMCIQLQEVATLPKLLATDTPERCIANDKVDSDLHQRAQAQFRNLLLETATLGSSCWPLAQAKAQTLLQGTPNMEASLRLLEQVSKGEHLAVVKEAGQLVLKEETAGPMAMALLRCSASRAWGNPAVIEVLADVSAKHSLVAQVEKFLTRRRHIITDYGFMLRALPPRHLKIPDMMLAEGEEATDDAAAQDAGSAAEAADVSAAAEGGSAEDGEGSASAPEPEPLEVLAAHQDSVAMGHVELMRAAPLLQELCALQFNWHDISRFKYFDLEQITVPDMPSENLSDSTDIALEATSLDALARQDLREAVAGDEAADAEEQELDEWQKKAGENAENRSKAFDLLRRLLRPLCRAATFAKANNSHVLMQAIVIMAMNALLIVAPTPGECLPTGIKANPLDTDPDTYVGAQPSEAAEGGEAEASEEEVNDVWLNLAVISQLMVETLGVVSKRRPMRAEGDDDVQLSVPPAQPGDSSEKLEKEQEAKVIRSAKGASKLLAGADEEVQDKWYSDRQELDMTSTATFIAFSTLCLYQMRRWSAVVKLCESFNDVTCFVFAPTFLPLAVGAQKEVMSLSHKAVSNTERYLEEIKASYDEAQKKLSRKLLRQLTLTGTMSRPQQKFDSEKKFYEEVRKRQGKLHDAWSLRLKSLEKAQDLASKAAPLALEQLRKSRLLLSEYLRDFQIFNVGVQRGMLKGAEKVGRHRALKLAGSALVSSYRKAVELLRKRQMTDSVVLALHELGNLLWLEGDSAGAQASWSDAIDAAFQFVYAVQNWRECLEKAVTPPTTAERSEILLLAVVILAKQAQLTKPGKAISHLHAAIFASGIVEAVVTSNLPHPQQRMQLSPDVYTMRGIFFGLRESRLLLRPNSVHGGVDGTNFLGALSFCIQAVMTTNYQPGRCVPLCSLYTYIANDVCRHQRLAVQGRLLMARSLIRCRSLGSAWWALFSLAKGHGFISPMHMRGKLEQTLAEATAKTAVVPFQVHEEPTSEANVKAMNTLLELVLLPENGVGDHNVLLFTFMQVEFLLCVSSYVRVAAKPADPEEKQRLAWLEKAAAFLAKLWKDLTGNDDDVDAWAAAVSTANREADKRRKAGEVGADEEVSAGVDTPMMNPGKALSKEEADLSVELRLAKALVWELRGDLAKAVTEILYGMRFVRLLAVGDKATLAGDGGVVKQRIHPDMKAWMMLRRRIVHLLVAQGRLTAAAAQIDQGLEECRAAHDEFSHVELLAAKVKVDALMGKVSELRGTARSGAVPSAERCLGIAQQHLLAGTPAVVHVRMMLGQLIAAHPNLRISMHGKTPSEMSKESLDLQKNPREEEDEALLMLKGQVVVSPIAKDLQEGSRAATASAMEEYSDLLLQLAESAAQSAQDLDTSLEVMGFDLQPGDVNTLMHISDGHDAEKPAVPILPLQQPEKRQRPTSDSRPPPNLYMEEMPLRLHLDLVLAKVRLDLGDLQVAQSILTEAEARMSRCMYLLPWLYIEFCNIKLRWRRLDIQAGCNSGYVAPAGASNAEKFRDPKSYALGLVPPTDSPLYRTYMQRMPTLSLTHDSEWAMVATAKADILGQFLQEWSAVAQISFAEGGHDYQQILALLREALEEVLRVAALGGSDSQPSLGQVYALFACLVGAADTRKGLLTDLQGKDDQKAVEQDAGGKKASAKAAAKPGAGGAVAPGAIDTATLPPRVSLDLQANLARQGHEGALGYSENAKQESQKGLLFNGVLKYMHALRQQCESFGSIFHGERLLCDQLHMALAQASEQYRKAKVLDAALFDAIKTPPEAPPSNDMLIYWMEPEVSLVRQPPSEASSFLLYLCPVEGQPDHAAPMVARASAVPRKRIRELQDGLATDAEHYKPAKAVAESHISERLQTLASCLRGTDISSKDEEMASALEVLLATLRVSSEETKDLDAALTVALTKQLTRLLDQQSPASRVAHAPLNAFLRVVLRPLRVL